MMTALAWVNDIALLIHILSVLGIMALLLMQLNKTPKRINPGVFHAGVTAMVAGILMVALRTPLHHQDPTKWPLLNNAWVGTKFIILVAILAIVMRNFKKAAVRTWTWALLVGLTTANILIAILW